MVAGRYDIVIQQGETFSRVFTYQNSAGTAINLTGYTARMHIRDRAESSSLVLELTNGNSRIALGGVAGTVTLTIAATDTVNLPSEFQGVYDLELISGGGVVTSFLRGAVS